LYDTFDEWIDDSLANCDPYFKLIIIAETDKGSLVWPIWLSYCYIDNFSRIEVFDFLSHIVKTERGLNLA
jgi:hypothetical protein